MRILAGAILAIAATACGDVDQFRSRDAYVVTVHVEGPGRLLSLPPGIDCPSTCSAAFANGSWVTLAASSGDGASFVEWSRGCGGAAGCGFPVRSDVDVGARFEPTAAAQNR